MEKFIQNLQDAEKLSARAGHLLYVTFPMLNDKKILFKILEEINKTNIKCINSILHYEYLKGTVRLNRDPQINLRNFIKISSRKYDMSEREISIILELFKIFRKHKASPVEFIKNGNLIILSDEMDPTIVSQEKIKEFFTISKAFLDKTKKGVREKV